MIMLLDIVDEAVTLDRISAYDFIAIYSEDFSISNISLNGENGFSFSELSSRRKLIKAAIRSLVVDGLVVASDDETGIVYSISALGRRMSESFRSEYAEKYRKLMRLVAEGFGKYSDVRLLNEINRKSTDSLRR